MYERLVLVTRKTDLEALAEYYGDYNQMRLTLEGGDEGFATIEREHEAYVAALRSIQTHQPAQLDMRLVERDDLPSFSFEPADLVITLGHAGLLINTAQYLQEQTLMGINSIEGAAPDGICCASWRNYPGLLEIVLKGEAVTRQVTLAEAWLSSGARKRAIGDLFVGQITHATSRYRLRHGTTDQLQASSGVIVATGLGSTGWIRSVLAGARSLTAQFDRRDRPEARNAFAWHEQQLAFAVREPYAPPGATQPLTYGLISEDNWLEVDSLMLEDGVIFADGMFEDPLPFPTGTTAQIYPVPEQLHLVVG